MAWRKVRRVERPCLTVKVILVLVLVVLLVVPLRNAVLFFVLPGMWMQHSSFFLVKVMLDFQHFPVEDTPLSKKGIPLEVNLADIETKILPKMHRYSEYYKHVKKLKQVSAVRPEANAELATLTKFEPILSLNERALALFTLDIFIRACEAANLTYFLISGTLMGVNRHHGMIPWDDDFDIAMNASDWRKIRDVLGNIPETTLFAPAKVQWKFFLKSLPKTNKPFKWPNIDIFFFNEDDTFVWAQTWGGKLSVCSKKSDVFPLIKKKFELWYMPVPRSTNLLLSSEFGDYRSVCATNSYNHKITSDVSPLQVRCEILHKVFPFVFLRSTPDPRYMVEVKMIGNLALSNITLPVINKL